MRSAYKNQGLEQDDNKSLNRFPSIQQSKGQFNEDIVSSRRSRLSKDISKRSVFSDQKHHPGTTRASSVAKMDFAANPDQMFMSP